MNGLLFNMIKKNLLLGVTLRAVIEKSINALLKLDPVMAHQLKKLSGKVIRIHCLQPDVTFFILFEQKKVRLLKEYDKSDDGVSCALSGKITSLVKLALAGENAQDILSQENIQVSGEVGVLLLLSEIIQQSDLDWEGFFSRYFGDFIAHHGANKLRQGKDVCDYAARESASALKEWLLEESGYFPPPQVVKEFKKNVTNLQLVVDRLEAKVDNLIESKN